MASKVTESNALHQLQLVTIAVLFCVGLACVNPASAGLQHDVGGDAGWTLPSRANFTYQQWVATQSFAVGDTLFFKYNASHHNVMEVSQQDYYTCNYSQPMLTYDDGMTVIQLNETGTFYFICGVPTHCDVGQKVAVTVDNSSAPAPASTASDMPAVAPSGANFTAAAAPAPSPAATLAPTLAPTPAPAVDEPAVTSPAVTEPAVTAPASTVPSPSTPRTSSPRAPSTPDVFGAAPPTFNYTTLATPIAALIAILGLFF